MKLRHLLPVLLLCLPVLVSAETDDSSDLVKREGLHYKKFTDVPFTGKTSGQLQATYKDGKEHGPYAWYLENGQLWRKGTYRGGKEHGPYVKYRLNGQLKEKGAFKDGKEHGPYVWYHENGHLERKGTFKNGKRDGPWVFYNQDGTKRMTPWMDFDEGSGLYRDGKKVLSQ